ncbi:MAG: TRAM domain-containing protein, partial [Bacteroidales bacterium]|nr:TRAM domain-containing protein [Bacteroidales bacterium]
RYLDIPFQHISDGVLQSMRRGGGSAYIYDLIARIRETIPGIALRTTLISGYPTETKEQHKELVEFVRRSRFERLGVFAYSREEDTPAYELGDPVKASEKNRRVNEIMKLQEKISREINNSRVGSTMRVIIDSEETDCYMGRTEFDSPDVDNTVFVGKERQFNVGEFYDVEITDAAEYDLFGSVVSKS